MGLLEKALQYKQEINKQGKTTLIDTIIGPAETEFINKKEDDKKENNKNENDILELAEDEIKAIVTDEDLFSIEESKTVSTENKSSLELPSDERFNLTESQNDTTIVLTDEAALEDIYNDENILGPEDEPDINTLREVYNEKYNEKEDVMSTNYSTQRGEKESTAIRFRISNDESELPKVQSDNENKLNKKDIYKDSLDDTFDTLKDEKVVLDERPETISRSDFANNQLAKPDKKFQDFVVLYEIGKEILKSQSLNQLYDTILFSVMGQIGSASATLLLLHDDNTLHVADSRGITIKNRNIRFDITRGLFAKLMESKGVVDIEHFKYDAQYKDEYFQLIAIDTRLFIPLRYDSKVFGALVLGDKITIGDYTEEEIDFIEQISEFASIAYEKVSKIEHLEYSLKRSVDEKEFWSSIEEYKSKVRRNPKKEEFIESTKEIFKKYGISSFAIYYKNDDNGSFDLLCTDEQDILLLKENVPTISETSPFVQYVSALYKPIDIEDFDKNRILRETFGDSNIRKMTLCWINPLKIADELIGFACVFRLQDYQFKEMLFERFTVISNTVMNDYISLEKIRFEYDNYCDTIMPVINRIQKELLRAKGLSIPITFILFTIKNLKRYHALNGIEKTKNLLNTLKTIILSRLSTGDFAIKVDRNKFLIILVGKNKKYAIPFANALKTEIVQQFSNREIQLLVTFLMSEYPEDGEDIFSLLDAID